MRWYLDIQGPNDGQAKSVRDSKEEGKTRRRKMRTVPRRAEDQTGLVLSVLSKEREDFELESLTSGMKEEAR